MPRIILIERDIRLRDWCRLHLEAANFDVTAFEDGRRGYDAAIRERPDIVIIDVDAATMNGFAIAAALRSNGRTALIPLLLTCDGQRSDLLAQAQAIEPHGVITKPFTHATLLEAINA